MARKFDGRLRTLFTVNIVYH